MNSTEGASRTSDSSRSSDFSQSRKVDHSHRGASRSSGPLAVASDFSGASEKCSTSAVRRTCRTASRSQRSAALPALPATGRNVVVSSTHQNGSPFWSRPAASSPLFAASKKGPLFRCPLFASAKRGAFFRRKKCAPKKWAEYRSVGNEGGFPAAGLIYS